MKKEILLLCRQMVGSKIEAIDKEMAALQESANSDTKSAMGDKYETGRAMIQLEQENLYTRKSQLLEQAQILAQLNTSTSELIQTGSLVYTQMGIFYISAGLGKLTVDNVDLFAVSADSPIAQKLMGKQKGDQYELNGRVNVIDKIL